MRIDNNAASSGQPRSDHAGLFEHFHGRRQQFRGSMTKISTIASRKSIPIHRRWYASYTGLFAVLRRRFPGEQHALRSESR
jgi:hypothetical protein